MAGSEPLFQEADPLHSLNSTWSTNVGIRWSNEKNNNKTEGDGGSKKPKLSWRHLGMIPYLRESTFLSVRNKSIFDQREDIRIGLNMGQSSRAPLKMFAMTRQLLDWIRTRSNCPTSQWSGSTKTRTGVIRFQGWRSGHHKIYQKREMKFKNFWYTTIWWYIEWGPY